MSPSRPIKTVPKGTLCTGWGRTTISFYVVLTLKKGIIKRSRPVELKDAGCNLRGLGDLDWPGHSWASLEHPLGQSHIIPQCDELMCARTCFANF